MRGPPRWGRHATGCSKLQVNRHRVEDMTMPRFAVDAQRLHRPRLTRRAWLRLGTGTALGAAAALLPRAAWPASGGDTLFRELDATIEAARARYHIPGAAVGVFHNGREY